MENNADRGYNGNPLLKKVRKKIVWTPQQIEEWLKCAHDPIYFAEKYIKIVHVDKGLIPIQMYDYQKEIVTKLQHNRRVAVVTSRQAGKALAIDTIIPLADGGWTTMGDLKVGDTIIGRDGKPTKVVFKSQTHNKPTYAIQFEGEHETVVACEDHLWQVFDRNDRKVKILDTKTIASSYCRLTKSGKHSYRYSIFNCQPIQYNEQDLPVDPYVLGTWLGQTNMTTSTNTSPALQQRLEQQQVVDNNHIPRKYLFASIDQRTRLLQGLMDSGGVVKSDGMCCIQLSSKTQQLVSDIELLLNSLGFKYTSRYNSKTDYIRLSWMTSHDHIIPVTVDHKLQRIKKTLPRDRRAFSRSIISVKLTESVPTQCIMVDNDDHMFVFGRHYIPTHNTTTAVAVILHYVLFNEHKTVALLANKGDAAREILERIKIAYEALPQWLQQGVEEWNKGNITLENGCKVIAAATSSSAIRGKSISLLYIDEAAFVENWDDFFASVFPTISSGETTKVLLTSTPNGLNHFYKTCMGAKEGKNGYQYVEVPWQRVPGRDDAWKHETLATMDFDYEKFAQEFECTWLGSSGTLITGAVLKTLVGKTPLVANNGLIVYEHKKPGNTYVLVADVSRGKGLDYSAFQIIDVTKMPYNQVCVYRNNMVTPIDFAEIIVHTAKAYNNATVLVEINDTGGQVADSLFYDYEYEGIICTENAGARGKRISSGFSNHNVDRGIRTTKTVKAVGCAMLKLLIEQRQLIINDHTTIYELSRFSKRGSSYQAESGCNDDLVMCLVLFGWMSDQQYFKELTDINTLMRLRDKTEQDIEAELTPFGFFDDGMPDDNNRIIDLTQAPHTEFQSF